MPDPVANWSDEKWLAPSLGTFGVGLPSQNGQPWRAIRLSSVIEANGQHTLTLSSFWDGSIGQNGSDLVADARFKMVSHCAQLANAHF